MIAFTCPKCDAKLKAIDERAGTRFKCGKCGDSVKVPGRPAPKPPVVAEIVTAEDLDDDQPVRQCRPNPGRQRSRGKGFPLWTLAIIIPTGLLLFCCVIPVGILSMNRRVENLTPPIEGVVDQELRIGDLGVTVTGAQGARRIFFDQCRRPPNGTPE